MSRNHRCERCHLRRCPAYNIEQLFETIIIRPGGGRPRTRETNIRKTRQRTWHHTLRTEYAWRCVECGHIIWSVYE